MTVAEAKAKVVNWANSQVGYHEKASNSNLDSFTGNSGSANWNKYAADIDKNYPGYFNGSKNGYEWCTSFVTDDFLVNFGAAATHKMLYTPNNSMAAGCVYAVQYFKAAGAYYSTPEVGDQWFAKDSDGDPCHTGIVVAVNGSQFTVVEGNKNNQVEKNIYNVGGYTTHGFGRPKWSVVSSVTYTEGWKQTDGKWWYQHKDGSYPKAEWAEINGKWYYFGEDGYMAAGKWVYGVASPYYLGENGAMVTNRTLRIDGDGKLIPAGAYYEKLGDVTYKPYREALDAAVKAKILSGESGTGDNMVINLSEEAVRMIVYMYRAGCFK